MATQTIEFRSPPSQTITAKLFAVGSDTQVDSQSATEATNRKGTYSAAYTDVSPGEYELIAFVGAVPVARWFVTLTLATATFQVYDSTVEKAIKAKTDNLPADPADQSAVEAAITAATSGLATAANQVILIDGIGWTLASPYGACANPQAANALVQLAINGYAYSGQYAGLTSTGVRTAPTLTKV